MLPKETAAWVLISFLGILLALHLSVWMKLRFGARRGSPPSSEGRAQDLFRFGPAFAAVESILYALALSLSALYALSPTILLPIAGLLLIHLFAYAASRCIQVPREVQKLRRVELSVFAFDVFESLILVGLMSLSATS